MFQTTNQNSINLHCCWLNHHFPMVFLWFSYGFPMVFLWFYQAHIDVREVRSHKRWLWASKVTLRSRS